MSFSVIIPSRNAANVTACIEAIMANEPGLWHGAPYRSPWMSERIIVVDDGVDWESEEWNRFTGNVCCVVPGVKPFVFSRNCNLGIQAAGDQDVILLNDDALLESEGGFTILAQAARAHPEIGLIGAVTNNTGNPNQFRRAVGLRGEKRMVCFICAYIPRATIQKVGLLDERYVNYGVEDDDYCFTVRKAGLQIAVHDGCFVDHKRLHSDYRENAAGKGDFRPNLKLFIDKWGHDNWGLPAPEALGKWGFTS